MKVMEYFLHRYDSNEYLLFIMKLLVPDVNEKQLVIFLNNTIFSFIFFWIVAILISKIFSRNVELASIEADSDSQSETVESVSASTINLRDRVDFISLAAQEQKSGIEEILRHISEIKNISMSNNEGAADLHHDSEELVTLMNSFQKTIDEYSG